MRFTKYEEGDFFKPHKDGNFCRNDNERSIFTLQIYLNDKFEGGNTEFYDTLDKNRKLLCSVKPVTGTAIIFNHDVPHAGMIGGKVALIQWHGQEFFFEIGSFLQN